MFGMATCTDGSSSMIRITTMPAVQSSLLSLYISNLSNAVIISLAASHFNISFVSPHILRARGTFPLFSACSSDNTFPSSPYLATPLQRHYHMESYRAASALTDGAVILSPVLRTNPNHDTQGRIDFLLAWGIELSRDGNRLDGSRNPRLENYAR